MKFKSAICFLLAAVLAAYSCSSVKYVPTETKIETVYKDSLRIKDTTVIHTETIVRDYAVAPDTLHLKGEHSYATAYLDTAQGAIKGELREKPWKEKNVYKEKIVTRDSLVYINKPYPVEVEKKYIPNIFKFSFIYLIMSLLFIFYRIYKHFRK